MIVVFLRGGWDALNVVPVIGGPDRGLYDPDRGLYEAARPAIKIPASGAGAALNLNGQFGLHPSMASLYEMYQQKKLAIVHAAGLTSDTRSHFDAQQFIELGTPGAKSSSTGWITRHLQSSPFSVNSAVFPALSTGGGQAMSLAGYSGAVAMNNPGDFNLDGWSNYVANQRTALRTFYAGSGFLDAAARETLDTIDLIESTAPGDYTPANGAQYPNSSFSDNLQSIAQLIKMNLGLHVATIASACMSPRSTWAAGTRTNARAIRRPPTINWAGISGNRCSNRCRMRSRPSFRIWMAVARTGPNGRRSW